MWRILENKIISRQCKKIPQQVLKKYELWKNLVFRHGPDILKNFSGFHDEALKGERKGERSSRLNLQYRVIYTINITETTIYVLEITPHQY